MITNDPYTKTTRQIPSTIRAWRETIKQLQPTNQNRIKTQKPPTTTRHTKQRTTPQHQTKQT